MQTTPTPLIPISIGELIDKITILNIKSSKIKEEIALKNIYKELEKLNIVLKNLNLDSKSLLTNLTNKLQEINTNLWEIEDALREYETQQNFGSQFIELARSVYKLNDERARIKKTINQSLGSELIEEKSYC